MRCSGPIFRKGSLRFLLKCALIWFWFFCGVWVMIGGFICHGLNLVVFEFQIAYSGYFLGTGPQVPKVVF